MFYIDKILNFKHNGKVEVIHCNIINIPMGFNHIHGSLTSESASQHKYIQHTYRYNHNWKILRNYTCLNSWKRPLILLSFWKKISIEGSISWNPSFALLRRKMHNYRCCTHSFQTSFGGEKKFNGTLFIIIFLLTGCASLGQNTDFQGQDIWYRKQSEENVVCFSVTFCSPTFSTSSKIKLAILWSVAS